MRLRVLTTKVLPIGIDLGTSAVKLVQLRNFQGNLELLGAGRIDLPDACQDDPDKRMDFLGEQLGPLIGRNGFSGRQCILSLPAALTFVQHVKTARISAGEVSQALRWELEGKLPFAAEGAVIRHVIAGETYNEREANQEVIVLAVSREVVDAHLAMVRKARLEVVGLNVEPCAILECFARLFRRADDAKKAVLFMDVGQASTQVVIAHGPRLVFAKNLHFGARQLDEAVAAALSIPTDKARTLRSKLAEETETSPDAEGVNQATRGPLESAVVEITKCLRYYESVFPTTPIERAIFLGGQAMDRRLCQTIAQQLNLPAQIGDPLVRIGRSGNAATEALLESGKAQPAWAVAVGLSLGAHLPSAA